LAYPIRGYRLRAFIVDRRKPMKRSCLIVAAMIGISGSAGAQPMSQVCNAIPCIRDANNKIVGIPYGYLNITRKINGEWFQFGDAANDGIGANGVFYYQGANCSGQAYVQTDRLMPTTMVYDGSAFFAPAGTPQEVTTASYSYPAKPQRGGHCVNQNCADTHGSNPCEIIAAPARKIETVTFYPPFKVQ
jgi:hypothetical protein